MKWRSIFTKTYIKKKNELALKKEEDRLQKNRKLNLKEELRKKDKECYISTGSIPHINENYN